MRLLELDIKGFGLLRNQHISFNEGINIIYGQNETGKSTLHTFIKSMLYGMKKSEGIVKFTDTWTKYEPWMDKGCYKGVMKLEYDNQVYVIERDFSVDAKTPLKIINETNSLVVESEAEFIDAIMCGLTESGFMNTISIGQLKSSGDEGMYNELKRYIANVNTTVNMRIDTTKAYEYLQSQKRAFADQIVTEAAKSYTSDLSEIKNIEAEIASPEYGSKFTTIQEQTAYTSKRAEELQTRKEALIEVISSQKQNLINSGFSNKEEIEDYKETLNNAREEYKAALEIETPNYVRILSFIFSGLGIIFATIGLYTLIVGERNVIAKAFLINNIAITISGIVLAVIFFLLAAWLSNKYNTSASILSAAHEYLSDMYMDKLGDENITEENDKALDKKLDELINICDEIKDSEKEFLEINEALKEINNERNDITKSLEEHQISQWELEKQLEHLSNLKDEAAALKKVIIDNERLQFEIDAITLAQDLITHLSTSIKDSFGTYLNKEASELVSGITGGIYDSMYIDDELNIFMNTKHRLVPLEQISRGTMDQIYLALRLAVAKLLANDSEDVLPLLFDDSFANYDEKRLRSVFRWLNDTFKNRQILLFSCHKREAQMLTSQQIDFNLIDLK